MTLVANVSRGYKVVMKLVAYSKLVMKPVTNFVTSSQTRNETCYRLCNELTNS